MQFPTSNTTIKPLKLIMKHSTDMKKFYISFLLLSMTCMGYAQTNVSGSIFSNTSWTLAGSPYIVTGNIVVFDSVVLTVEPGVVVKFNSGTGIELRGILNAIGNSTDSIEFTSNLILPVMSSWTGITVIGTNNPLGVGNQVTMEYCKGQYAHNFIDLDFAYHGPYIFRHCYFANNYQTNHDGGMPTTIFENCKFESNNNGLGSCQFNSRVSNSFFINNVNGVLGIANVDTCYFSGNTGIALSPYGSTVGCTVQNNSTGVSCYFNSANNVFINNNVSNNNIGVEILSYFNGSINFTGNTICNNTTYNVKLLHVNNDNLSFNCWCSTDSSFIRSTIYDGYVNNSYGIVNYMPLAGSCPQINVGINTPSNNVVSSTTIFPNPFNNEIEIRTTNTEQVEIILFDMASRKLLQQKFTESVSLNTAQLAKGIYIYEVRNKNGTSTNGKVIKQ